MRTPRRLTLLAAFGALATLAGCEAMLTRPILYGTVRVVARSRSGVPLPGITVQLYTGQRPMGYSTTDDSGRATFSRVPPNEYGLVMGLRPDYADLSELSAVPPGTQRDGIRVAGGTDTVVAFTFARRGNGALEARVRDTGGAPLRGITVTFYSSVAVLREVRTDVNGLARMDTVPFGQYGAYVVPPDSLGVPGSALLFADGLIVDRDVSPRAEFSIASCLGSIAVAARDQFDAPIPGISVALFDGSGVRRRRTADAAGQVAFTQVPCGERGVWLEALAGYTVPFVRDSGYVDGLVISNGANLAVTLRATKH